MRVTRLLAVSEGGGNYPVPPPMVMMEARAQAASTKIDPGEQKVQATLSMPFQKHHPHRWLPLRVCRRERHRLGVVDLNFARLFEPAVEQGKGVCRGHAGRLSLEQPWRQPIWSGSCGSGIG